MVAIAERKVVNAAGALKIDATFDANVDVELVLTTSAIDQDRAGGPEDGKQIIPAAGENVGAKPLSPQKVSRRGIVDQELIATISAEKVNRRDRRGCKRDGRSETGKPSGATDIDMPTVR